MSKEQFKTTAKDVFDRFPEAEEVFVTADGQAFTNSHHAKNHASNNRTKETLEVHKFLRSEMKKEVVKNDGSKTPKGDKDPEPPKNKKGDKDPEPPKNPIGYKAPVTPKTDTPPTGDNKN